MLGDTNFTWTPPAGSHIVTEFTSFVFMPFTRHRSSPRRSNLLKSLSAVAPDWQQSCALSNSATALAGVYAPNVISENDLCKYSQCVFKSD